MKLFHAISLGLMCAATAIGIIDYTKAVNSKLLHKVYSEKETEADKKVDNTKRSLLHDIKTEDYSRKAMTEKAIIKADEGGNIEKQNQELKKIKIANIKPPAPPSFNLSDVKIEYFSRGRIPVPQEKLSVAKPKLHDSIIPLPAAASLDSLSLSVSDTTITKEN
jgi:hypothetical protein